MDVQNAMAVAKEAAKTVVGTLNPNDRVGTPQGRMGSGGSDAALGERGRCDGTAVRDCADPWGLTLKSESLQSKTIQEHRAFQLRHQNMPLCDSDGSIKLSRLMEISDFQNIFSYVSLADRDRDLLGDGPDATRLRLRQLLPRPDGVRDARQHSRPAALHRQGDGARRHQVQAGAAEGFQAAQRHGRTSLETAQQA